MSQFSEEACRMMVNLFDVDNSGTINISEFSKLFGYITQWKGVFMGFDMDKSGTIDQVVFIYCVI